MDFSFALKKFISIGLTPVGISLELVLIGLFCVRYGRRLRKENPSQALLRFKGISGDLGTMLIFSAAVFLYLCSIELVAMPLSALLEQDFPALEKVETEPDFIVVLPGGHRYWGGKGDLSRLERKTFVRLFEGVQYWKQFPEATMVFTGTPQEVEPMARLAESMGVAADKILLEKQSKDTKDHPRFLRSTLQGKNFLLVTSAVHMPRSEALFRGQGLNPTAAPTDFNFVPIFPFSTAKLVPTVGNLLITDEAFHEHIGIVWAAMRRQSKEPAPQAPPVEAAAIPASP